LESQVFSYVFCSFFRRLLVAVEFTACVIGPVNIIEHRKFCECAVPLLAYELNILYWCFTTDVYY